MTARHMQGPFGRRRSARVWSVQDTDTGLTVWWREKATDDTTRGIDADIAREVMWRMMQDKTRIDRLGWYGRSAVSTLIHSILAGMGPETLETEADAWFHVRLSVSSDRVIDASAYLRYRKDASDVAALSEWLQTREAAGSGWDWHRRDDMQDTEAIATSQWARAWARGMRPVRRA